MRPFMGTGFYVVFTTDLGYVGSSVAQENRLPLLPPEPKIPRPRSPHTQESRPFLLQDSQSRSPAPSSLWTHKSGPPWRSSVWGFRAQVAPCSASQ